MQNKEKEKRQEEEKGGGIEGLRGKEEMVRLGMRKKEEYQVEGRKVRWEMRRRGGERIGIGKGKDRGNQEEIEL